MHLSIKIIIISIIILILVKLVFLLKEKYKPHYFWDLQPVARNITSKDKKVNIGIISNTKPKSINIDTYQTLNFDINDKTTNNNLTQFLNSHFLKGYHYQLQFLQWSITNNYLHNLALVTHTPRNLIGTISSRTINIMINKESLPIGFVDYLAVHKAYRKKRLATCLISKLVETNKNKCFLFKIENNPLPFDAICKFRYYALNLKSYHSSSSSSSSSSNIDENPSNTNWELLSPATIHLAYKYYHHKAKAYRLYQTYNEKEFIDWFLPRQKVISSFIKIKNRKVVAFSAYFHNQIKGGFMAGKDEIVSTVELMVFLSNNIYGDFKSLLNGENISNTDYLVTTNLANNMVFIDRMLFIPAKRCYLQMYNYATTDTYQPSEILLNVP